MEYSCEECGTKFSAHEAYCENWRETNKKFGCPNCKTMYYKRFNSRYLRNLIVSIPAILLIAVLSGIKQAEIISYAQWVIGFGLIFLLALCTSYYLNLKKETIVKIHKVNS
jgi:CXXC-20-CXXC protein